MEDITSSRELDCDESYGELEDYYLKNKHDSCTEPEETVPQDTYRITTTRRGESQSAISLSSRIKEAFIEELKTPSDFPKCMEHPDEDCQFYCFENNKLLCDQCITSGLYADLQVVNFKRAGARVRRKFSELSFEIENKVNLYDLLEKKLENRQEDLADVVLSCKEQIISEMEQLAEQIENKKQELLKRTDEMHLEKIKEFETIIQSMKKRKEELISIKSVIENTIETLDEAGVCRYFSKKAIVINSFLEEASSLSDPDALMNTKFFQEQFNLKKFQEQLDVMMVQLATLSGVEDTRKDNYIEYLFSNREDKSNVVESVQINSKSSLHQTKRNNPSSEQTLTDYDQLKADEVISNKKSVSPAKKGGAKVRFEPESLFEKIFYPKNFKDGLETQIDNLQKDDLMEAGDEYHKSQEPKGLYSHKQDFISGNQTMSTLKEYIDSKTNNRNHSTDIGNQDNSKWKRFVSSPGQKRVGTQMSQSLVSPQKKAVVKSSLDDFMQFDEFKRKISLQETKMSSKPGPKVSSDLFLSSSYKSASEKIPLKSFGNLLAEPKSAREKRKNSKILFSNFEVKLSEL